MAYTRCMYAPPLPPGMMTQETREGENARIACTDEAGAVWYLTEDSQVRDWLWYVRDGGTVEPYDETEFNAWKAAGPT